MDVQTTDSEQKSVLTMSLADRQQLHVHYMGFIKDGAIFVSTNEHFNLHEEVTLQLRLVEVGKRLNIVGRVVWIAPSIGQRTGEAGVGLQFIGEHRHKVKQFIEDALGELVKQVPAHPMY